MCKRRVRQNDIYFNHQGKRRGEEWLVDTLARADPPNSAIATQEQQQPLMHLSTPLPFIYAFPSANRSAGAVPVLPCTTEASYPSILFRWPISAAEMYRRRDWQLHLAPVRGVVHPNSRPGAPRRRSGDVTRKANRCAMRVARSW
jgi:hypothetical protein